MTWWDQPREVRYWPLPPVAQRRKIVTEQYEEIGCESSSLEGVRWANKNGYRVVRIDDSGTVVVR